MSFTPPKARGVFNPTNVVRNIPVIFYQDALYYQIINVDLFIYLYANLPPDWFDADLCIAVDTQEDLDVVEDAIITFYSI